MFVFAFVKCLVDRYEIKKKKTFLRGWEMQRLFRLNVEVGVEERTGIWG